jgi:hypothetical protein
MVGLADNPEYWRARAEETRTLGDSLNDKESKRIMLGIAKDYELAERAEERLKRRKKNNVIEALADRPSATPVLFGLTPPASRPECSGSRS